MSKGLEIVQSVLVELGIPDSEIRADASLSDDLSIDSVELVEIILSIEQKAEMPLDEKQLKDVHTVSELADFVNSQLQSK